MVSISYFLKKGGKCISSKGIFYFTLFVRIFLKICQVWSAKIPCFNIEIPSTVKSGDFKIEGSFHIVIPSLT